MLEWLDPDRERAGEKYERIRAKLIRIFLGRGCAPAEDLADKTIIRVTRRVHEIVDSYEGDPALYFYGVAHNVYLEYLKEIKKIKSAVPPPAPDPPETLEARDQCLQQCLESLSKDQRELVLAYYKEDKKAKIDHRKEMAERMGIESNALRIRAHRIRAKLQQCVRDCIKRKEKL